jgi:hypothetical protein
VHGRARPRRLRRRRSTHQLERDPLRVHRECARRSLHTRASTTGDVRFGLDRGRLGRSANPAKPASRYLATHACSDCRETPTSAATSLTPAPSNTRHHRLTGLESHPPWRLVTARRAQLYSHAAIDVTTRSSSGGPPASRGLLRSSLRSAPMRSS